MESQLLKFIEDIVCHFIFKCILVFHKDDNFVIIFKECHNLQEKCLSKGS